MLYFRRVSIIHHATIHNHYYLLSLHKIYHKTKTYEQDKNKFTTKLFDGMIMLRLGKTKLEKEEFYGAK